MASSSSRNGTRVIWIVVHTAEGIRKASDLVAFFNRSTDSSAHAVADDNTLLDNLVPYSNAAWTLRNGNTRSDNLELCGFANWTRAEWLTNHQGMLRNAANWIAARCHARGIPLTKLSPADVKAGRAGVIGHVDYTQGTGDGTHWDPGPGFPWDAVMAYARGEDDMTPEELLNYQIKRENTKLGGNTSLAAVLAWFDSHVDEVAARDAAMTAKLTALETKLTNLSVAGVDMDILADKVADRLAARLAD